jgi:hypothetical protein
VREDREGSALVEGALVVPVLVGVFEFSVAASAVRFGLQPRLRLVDGGLRHVYRAMAWLGEE